jgi:hypothetical protein
MAIIGKMDPVQFAKVQAKKDDEKRRAKKRAASRPEPLSEAADLILAQGKGGLTVQVKGVEQLNQVASELLAKRREATKQGLTRRLENGRWISREAQAEAIETADRLEKLGF